MARCTKEEALATRHRLLDAAELVFSEKGVSRSSLHDIAYTAGTSRGAIYWHFKNKADVFNAMMERITLPMEDALHQIGHDVTLDLLAELQRALLDALQKIETDAQTRRVFEVATLKVEYVDELLAVKARQLRVHADLVQQMQRSIEQAVARRGVALAVSSLMAAQGLHALLDGLVRHWLLAPGQYQLVRVAQVTMQAYLVGLGLTPAPKGAPGIP